MYTDQADAPAPYTLIDCAFMHLARELCRALPPSLSETAPERNAREQAFIAQVTAFQPANTAEFRIAGHFVLSSERAEHYLALADEPGLEPALVKQRVTMADMMFRRADSATRALLRMRAARKKTEDDPEAYARGERIEHHMTILMTEALRAAPPVSSNDLESSIAETETPARRPALASNTPFVSYDDPESHLPKTETLPRQPKPAPAAPLPPRPLPRHQEALSARAFPERKVGGADHPPQGDPVISSYDLETHLRKIETLPRQPAPGEPQRWRPQRPGYDIPWPPPDGEQP